MHVTAVFRQTASDVWPTPPNLWVDVDQTKNQVADLGPLDNYKVTLNASVEFDQRVYNRPTTSEVAGIWFEGVSIDEIVDDEENDEEDEEELYQGVVDSTTAGDVPTSMIGQRVVLPASFIGGPRDMQRRFLDAMDLVQYGGKPDIFLTMTCNPKWPEIQNELLPWQKAEDKPNVVSRVFHAKIEDLKEQLLKRDVLGMVGAYVYVIEFQKRGLPQAHFLLIMRPRSKFMNPDYYDKYVCAEIPNPAKFPVMHELVKSHMIHGPCGDINKKCQCMQGDAQRVELNEIKRFHDARYVSPLEAIWRIFSFALAKIYPNVVTLQVHLPNQQMGTTLGRLVSANPAEGERYYLRLLLCHVTGPTCFEDLYTHNNVIHPTIRKAALERGLIESDESLSQYLVVSSLFQFLVALRRLFATILVFYDPGDVCKLCNDHYHDIYVDLQTGGFCEVQEESSIVVEDDHLRAQEFLNTEQKYAYDEIMRHAVEAFDRTMQDITGVTLPFGGKIMVMRGDFKQVLPVVIRGTRAQIVDSSLRMSPLWSSIIKLRLITNMRAQTDPWFLDFLLRVGDGVEGTEDGSLIHILDDMVIPYTDNSKSLDALIDAIFPTLEVNMSRSDYIIPQAILSTKNDNVDEINDVLIGRFYGVNISNLGIFCFWAFTNIYEDMYRRLGIRFGTGLELN
ncbi:hypothetical protein LXL04_016368 [Taraxacum kok-saghyz]